MQTILLTKDGAKQVISILQGFLKSNATALEIEETDWKNFNCVVINNDKR